MGGGKMRRSGHVLSAGKRKIRGSRLTGEDTDDWEAAFQEFMAADDDYDIQPFLAGQVKLGCSPATARPKRRMVSPSHPHPYHGIRQRQWGRWSAEIRDPTEGARVWIGTFDTAADAVRAYDAEARRIHGPKANTNFPADTAAPYSDHPRPSSCSCSTDHGANNMDRATESASSSSPSSSSSKEVHGAAPSDTRILLECCSDDVMESLLACSDLASGSSVSYVANETCTGGTAWFTCCLGP